jgi:cytochrome c oxidase assembly protein subunit 15
LLLIFVGGVVTNTGSGLAVPDWPTTFGYNMFLYPPSQWVGGVLYEHSHRLLGSLVGLLTVALAAWLWFGETRRWVRWLAAVAVLAVIVQGVLGGLRVVLLQYGLAIVHGGFAHAYLALLAVLAISISPWWQRAAKIQSASEGLRLRRGAAITAAVVYLQILFGAMLTHAGERLDAHILFAALVVVAAAVLVRRIFSLGIVELQRPAILLALLVATQIALGIGTYLARFTSVRLSLSAATGLALPTTHRLLGALILLTAVLILTRVLRMTATSRGAVEFSDTAAAVAHAAPQG